MNLDNIQAKWLSLIAKIVGVLSVFAAMIANAFFNAGVNIDEIIRGATYLGLAFVPVDMSLVGKAWSGKDKLKPLSEAAIEKIDNMFKEAKYFYNYKLSFYELSIVEFEEKVQKLITDFVFANKNKFGEDIAEVIYKCHSDQNMYEICYIVNDGQATIKWTKYELLYWEKDIKKECRTIILDTLPTGMTFKEMAEHLADKTFGIEGVINDILVIKNANSNEEYRFCYEKTAPNNWVFCNNVE
jgi:hypothetical protein